MASSRRLTCGAHQGECEREETEAAERAPWWFVAMGIATLPGVSPSSRFVASPLPWGRQFGNEGVSRSASLEPRGASKTDAATASGAETRPPSGPETRPTSGMEPRRHKCFRCPGSGNADMTSDVKWVLRSEIQGVVVLLSVFGPGRGGSQ